jgi:hypothetical protein
MKRYPLLVTTEPEQLTLPLEFPMSDKYTIELLRRPDEAVEDVYDSVRKHEAKTPEDALAFVDALRDDATVRYMVRWQSDEPTQSGKMFGLASGGTTYVIAVDPALDLS